MKANSAGKSRFFIILNMIVTQRFISWFKRKPPILIFAGVLFFTGVLYFSPVWKDRQIPFPGHLLASFFSPWKDTIWPGYPVGVPRKDLLGFDTVRMMGPWRHFITAELQQKKLPVWNPHQFMGEPMLGNGQSAIWFPLNLLYLIFPFYLTWTVLVVLQPVLASISMCILLRTLKKTFWTSIIISLAYGFSGWMSVWIEWNILGFIYALLPLGIVAIQKKNFLATVIVMSLIVFAGHPQIAFIAFVVLFIFALTTSRAKWFLVVGIIVGLATAIQWWPILKYYKEANREHQSSEFTYEKTLLPWTQLPQFLVPNYFGNPATGNFSGSANFVETTSYIGIGITGFALIGLAQRSQRKFAMTLLATMFLFALPNPVSFIFGKTGIPILSTSVASRWLLIWPLAISILASHGIDELVIEKKSRYLRVGFLMIGLLGVLWALTFFESPSARITSQRNLLFASATSALFFMCVRDSNHKKLFLGLLGIVTMVELIQFGQKTMTYTEKMFLYPNMPVLEMLQELSSDGSRFASSEGNALESNFATYYGLYDIAGYDALYPRRVGELVWAGHHDGMPVDDFSRSTVVTPTVLSRARDILWNLAGVKWVIHKDDQLSEHPGHNASLFSPDQFDLIWQDNKWQIYENKLAFPRSFFIRDDSWIGEGEDMIRRVYTERLPDVVPEKIDQYDPAYVEITADAPSDGYLILTDTYYPGWKALMDGQKINISPAFQAFRSIPISQGHHKIKFLYQSL